MRFPLFVRIRKSIVDPFRSRAVFRRLREPHGCRAHASPDVDVPGHRQQVDWVLDLELAVRALEGALQQGDLHVHRVVDPDMADRIVRRLEGVVIDLLAGYRIDAERAPGALGVMLDALAENK